jgi:surfeit locus 1 family protein
MPNPMPSTALSTPRVSRRFRPRALPTLATIVAVVVFVAAGQWQQRRMEDKESLRAQFDAAAVQVPVALATLADATDWNALRYRTVLAAGEYDARLQVLVDNRVHDGHAGYHVITPLVLADGRTVLVNRGWTPQGASRAALPQVAPPAGPVTIRGRVAIPASRVFELSKDTTSGPVWQNLDPARFSAATGVAVLPVMIEALAPPSPPVPDDGLVRDWPSPDFGIEKHRIYMVQWYSFAALAIVLWVILNLRPAKRASRE